MKIHPDWWKRLFDRVYLTTDARSVCDEDLTSREVDMLEAYLNLEKNGAVLDLCGGHGRHSLELCRRGYSDVTVVDFSEYLIEVGRRWALSERLEVRFIEADARRTGLPEGRFDAAIVMANSFGYFSDARDDSLFLEEVYRILNARGTLLLDLINAEALVREFKPTAWHEIGDDIVVCRERQLQNNSVVTRELVISKSAGLVRDECYFVRLYTPEAISELLTKTGFSSVAVHKDFTARERSSDVGFLNNRMIVIASKGEQIERDRQDL